MDSSRQEALRPLSSPSMAVHNPCGGWSTCVSISCLVHTHDLLWGTKDCPSMGTMSYSLTQAMVHDQSGHRYLLRMPHVIMQC